MESNKIIFRDETASADLHPIHPGMQIHFMVTVTHVLTMDIELEIAGALTKGFIKDLGADFLEDETEF